MAPDRRREGMVVEVTSVRLTPENARGMAMASLDAELLRLHPEAASQLPEFERWYPLATVVFRERVPLDGSERTSTPLAELLTESRARLGR